jgi:hypothetical protein
MSEVPGPATPAPTGPDVSSKVSGPATALLVVGIINIPLALFGLVNNVMSMGAPPPALPPGAEMEGINAEQFTALIQGAGAVGIVFNIIAIVVAVVIIMGALKMKKLESYGFALTASILAMIPCLSACCILGLPFGIWSIVVLNQADVKAAFH